MDEVSRLVRKLFTENQLKVSLSELSRVTGVSPSQIRYWERKGYISSQQNEQNQNHYYTMATLIKVYVIKYFLDQGYTLSGAVEKEQSRRMTNQFFRQFVIDRVLTIKQIDDDMGEVSLGPLSDDPSLEVYASVANGKTSLHLRPFKKKDH